MTLFERFKDTKEEGFREEFVKPLLIQLGFFGISKKHGSQEFGKDYVFSELDRFGNMRHMVVQAKHEESLGQGKKIDDLISQVKQCFYVAYTLPSAPAEMRSVSDVYVFNSGEITANAETQFRNYLPKEFIASTHLFSGAQLETLSRSTGQVQIEAARNRINAVICQIGVNIHIWQALLDGVSPDGTKRTWDARKPMLHGIELLLSEPLLPDRIAYGDVLRQWELAHIIDGIRTKYYQTVIGVAGEAVTHDITLMLSLCREASQHAAKLVIALKAAVESLPPPTI